MIQTLLSSTPSENGRFAQRVSLVNACNQEERKSTTTMENEEEEKSYKKSFLSNENKTKFTVEDDDTDVLFSFRINLRNNKSFSIGINSRSHLM